VTGLTPQAKRFREIQSLNQLPFNKACEALLPPSWRGAGSLACLALVRWLVDESDQVEPGLEKTRLEDQLVALEGWPPQEAMEWLTTNDSGEVDLDAADLEGLDRLEAAEVLANQILENRVAKTP
jgi:hypothetical protein